MPKPLEFPSCHKEVWGSLASAEFPITSSPMPHNYASLLLLKLLTQSPSYLLSQQLSSPPISTGGSYWNILPSHSHNYLICTCSSLPSNLLMLSKNLCLCSDLTPTLSSLLRNLDKNGYFPSSCILKLSLLEITYLFFVFIS